ncbi:MAG: hypothetical protein FJ009_22380 [Chloroflexi bacterium]|nr:hypothetical protein [Chloroflexota bacterium]
MSQYTDSLRSPERLARRARVGVPEQSLATRLRRLGRAMWKHRWYYFLLIAPLTYYLIFRYIPIWNAQIAFNTYPKSNSGHPGFPNAARLAMKLR